MQTPGFGYRSISVCGCTLHLVDFVSWFSMVPVKQHRILGDDTTGYNCLFKLQWNHPFLCSYSQSTWGLVLWSPSYTINSWGLELQLHLCILSTTKCLGHAFQWWLIKWIIMATSCLRSKALPFIKTNLFFHIPFQFLPMNCVYFLHVISINILYPVLSYYINYIKAYFVLLCFCHYFNGKIDRECALFLSHTIIYIRLCCHLPILHTRTLLY